MGFDFYPLSEHTSLWEQLDALSVIDSLVQLERMSRHPSLSEPEKSIIYLELGFRCYNSRLFDRAYEFFSLVAAENLVGTSRLRYAELGVYYKNWPPAKTLEFIKGINPETLVGRDQEIYRFLLSRALWERVEISSAGITDPSLSALALDGEDVWGGTWNGGIFRYSRSSREITVLRSGKYKLLPNAITSIHTDRFGIWFAALDGISRYNKVTGEWSTIAIPDEVQPERIQKFVRIMGVMFLATVGHGLWRYINGNWERVNLDRVGANINGVFPRDERSLFLATRDRGLFIWNPSNNILQSLSGSQDAPINVTSVVQIDDTIWVGTYGEGLFSLNVNQGRWRRFRQTNGDIPDDWVMTLTAVGSTLFVGTFGGGIAVQNQSGFTFLEDLGSPKDIVAIQHHRDRLYLGTLREGLWIFNLAGYREITR